MLLLPTNLVLREWCFGKEVTLANQTVSAMPYFRLINILFTEHCLSSSFSLVLDSELLRGKKVSLLFFPLPVFDREENPLYPGEEKSVSKLSQS